MDVKERSEIDRKYQWNLKDIMPSDEAWEEAFQAVSKETGCLSVYRGKLDDPVTILECLRRRSDFMKRVTRLFSYAHMMSDSDTRAKKYKDMTSRIEMLYVRFTADASFVVPEILKLEESVILKMAEDPAFCDFDYMLRELARSKRHILSENEEKLLSGMGSFAGHFRDAFSMFNNADVKFAAVEDEHGERVELSHGTYGVLLQSGDQNVRKHAYESMFGAFKDMIHTISAIYAGEVKLNNYYAAARRYDSALEKSMDAEHVSAGVYRNLVEAVGRNLPLLHRYMHLRKKVLNLPELNMYDMHVSLFEGESLTLEYEDACRLVKEALAPLGPEYAALLDRAFSERWIDVYENKGKRSGAYCSDAYGVHPYVLLNYQKTTHDVFTIAHELGHAMHTYFSAENQVYEKSDYEIFVAEVASTVNEVLLLKHLMKGADADRKKFLLSYYLDMFRTTVYRQTQFAEFEETVHRAAGDEVSLTPEYLSEVYLELNRKYYGEEVNSDALIAYEWSRIPHFYSAFYVYKYATGLASAVIIANGILADGEEALRAYMKFLSAGGSTDPVSILRYAGVDLEKPDTLDIAFSEFGKTLEALEALI